MSGSDQDTLLEFPCQFPIKAMGLAVDNINEIVLALVVKHASDTTIEHVKQRPSKNGKYVAITVTINAQNKSQIDSIYYELTACEQIIMAL